MALLFREFFKSNNRLLWCLLSITLVGISWYYYVHSSSIDRLVQFNPAATAKLNHSQWRDFLNQNLQAASFYQNLIDYQNISSHQQQLLAQYLSYLSQIDIVQYNQQEALAFWINLYNALVVKVVLDNYPVESILKIDQGPWKQKLFLYKGYNLSLDNIEHDIIRQLTHDPRVHYALNCSAISCPTLQNIPFYGDIIDTQLDNAARIFINSPHGVLANNTTTIFVSSLFRWYKDDFGGTESSIIAHLKQHAYQPLQRALQKNLALDYMEYDWSLNDVKKILIVQ